MPRSIALAATAVVQSFIALSMSSPCFAQEDTSSALLIPSTTAGSMAAMSDGLGPLTIFITLQVVVMTVLALVMAAIMRTSPVRRPTAHSH